MFFSGKLRIHVCACSVLLVRVWFVVEVSTKTFSTVRMDERWSLVFRSREPTMKYLVCALPRLEFLNLSKIWTAKIAAL